VPQNNVLCRKHNKLACISLRISLQSSRLASRIVNPIIIKQADLPSLNKFHKIFLFTDHTLVPENNYQNQKWNRNKHFITKLKNGCHLIIRKFCNSASVVKYTKNYWSIMQQLQERNQMWLWSKATGAWNWLLHLVLQLRIYVTTPAVLHTSVWHCD